MTNYFLTNFFSYPKPQDNIEIYRAFAETYSKEATGLGDCPDHVLGTDNVLTDYIYHEYNTPMITTKISCCEYPVAKHLPLIWRNILKPTMELLNSVLTGKILKIVLVWRLS